MPLALAHVTFDCADPRRVAAFWAAALGRSVDEGAGEYFASIDDKAPDRPSWFFIKVPEAKSVKNRVHVDLSSPDRDGEVQRLTALGASLVSEHDEWGASWIVLTDPEGNEFCVGQAPAE